MSEISLKKNIGIIASLSTVMGTVIGGGVFFKTSSVANVTNSVSLTLLAWLVAGLLTICGGLTVSELGAAIPKTGGSVEYLRHTYGPLTGFLLGWAQMLIYVPANIAALAIVFATQVINLLHLNTSLLIPIAIACATSAAIINMFGSKAGGSVQSITFIFKLIPIFIIVIFGLLIPSDVKVSFFPLTQSSSDTSVITAFSGGLLATMFAYEGWLNLGTIAGEMKNPKKDLPKAIFFGLSFVTLTYILVNWIFLKNLPLNQIAGNDNTAFEVATKLFGNLGGKLITVGILISVYGTINGYSLTGARVPYALGVDNTLPFSKYFKKLSKKNSAPYVGSLFILLISSLMILLGGFDLLTDMLVFVIWMFNCILFIAVFILRKREPELKRPYRVPGYPIIPIIALLGGLFILITTIINQLPLALLGILLTLIGIPIYYFHQFMLKKNK